MKHRASRVWAESSEVNFIPGILLPQKYPNDDRLYEYVSHAKGVGEKTRDGMKTLL